MKTTTKHFDLFRKEVYRWIDEFGLGDWRIDCYHEHNMDGARASCVFRCQEMAADIYLEREWEGDKITTYKVKTSALHEVSHILLAKLYELAHNRFTVTEDQISEATEGIIRRLERALIGPK